MVEDAAPVAVQVQEYLARAVPTALWGPGDGHSASTPPDGDDMLIPGALMGVRLGAPEPTPSGQSVVLPLSALQLPGVPVMLPTQSARARRNIGSREVDPSERAARREAIVALLRGLQPDLPAGTRPATVDLPHDAALVFQAPPDTAAVGQVPPSVGAV